MKSLNQRTYAAGLALLLGPALAAAETQNLSAEPASLVVADGQRFGIDVNYDTSDGNPALTGFGARLHWDASKLRFNGLSSVFDATGIVVGQDESCQDDTETDYDEDPGTRCYVQVAWVDTDGGWPGSLPVMLFGAGFTSQLGPGGSAAIRFSSGGTALGYELATTAVQIDSDQSAVPLTPAERVESAYVAFYGRPADCPGFEYWVGLLADGGLRDIIDDFGTSAEFDDRYGGLTDAELVDTVYEQMFNRPPDPEGRAFYIGMLQSGQMTLQTITVNVLDGARNTDRTIVENKIEVAGYFTDRLCANGLVYTGLDEAIAIVSGVDPTADSVAQAEAEIDTLIADSLQ